MIGKRAADSYLIATGIAKKDIMCKALAGDGRSKGTGWLPRYMTFSQGGGYTERPRRSDHPPTARWCLPGRSTVATSA